MTRRLAPALALALACLCAGTASAAVTTYGSDTLRTGWYPDQASLTPALVTGGTFGKLFETPVDGQVYAQPLVSNDTLLTVTEKNWIYGLNPRTGAVKWSRNVGTPWNPADVSCSDLTPSIGITGTPVIDSAGTGTAYFFAKSYASGTSGPARWDAHAIDLATGDERPGFPVAIQGTGQNNPLTTFDATHELQRPGLLLLDGVVYAGFGGHCDREPFQGWVVGVSTSGEVRTKWVALGGRDRSGAGIWQSGGGLLSDGPGQILLTTGNSGSPPVPTAGSSPPADLGQSVVRLQVQPNGALAATDFFSPYDSAGLDAFDTDLGSAQPVELPAPYFGTQEHPRLVVQDGKQGYIYLLDGDHLGGAGMGPQGGDDVIKKLGPNGAVFGRPGVWPGDGGYVYIVGSSGNSSAAASGYLRYYRYALDGAGQPTLALVAGSTDAWGFSSSSPVITSDGTTSGSAIVWAIWTGGGSGAGAQLRAYSAIPSGGHPQLLWSAPIGTATKFTPPGVADGRVYVGTRDGKLIGFGAPVDPPLSGSNLSFPATTIGQSSAQTATLTATRAVTVTGVSASGSQFAAGTPSLPLPATLAAGDQISVPVTFTPSGAGPIGATLHVATSSLPVDVGLAGTGRAPSPVLSVDPEAVSFGGVRRGGHATATLMLANVGADPLTIQGVTAPDAPFTIQGGPAAGHVLQPGDSVALDVAFDPTEPGSFIDQITVTSDGGDVDLGLSGTSASDPKLEIAPAALDYGAVTQGASARRTFTVRNAGGTALLISKSKPPASGVFTATMALSEGTTLGPGESVEQTVEFRPAAAGLASDTWTITGDDGSGVHEVHLSGSGASITPLPPAALPPLVGLPDPTPFPQPVPATLASLRLDPASFRARRGSRVRFELQRAALLTLAVERSRGPQYARVGRPWTVQGRQGANTVALPGRVAGRLLAPGRYRLRATAAGAAPRFAVFRVAAAR